MRPQLPRPFERVDPHHVRIPSPEFEEWFRAIWAGSDEIPVPDYQGDGWNDYIAKRQLALGAWEAALHTKHSPVADAETLRANSDRYLWLRDVSVPPHNFYISVPVEFTDVRYRPDEVDKAIDAAIAAHRLTGSQP